MAEALLYGPGGLLAGGGSSSSAAGKLTYKSTDDLQDHLREIIEQKSTPTRAEHVSVSFELPSGVQFPISVTEAEYDAIEAVDPLFGGRAEAVDGLVSRTIKAGEALLFQARDDPVLQRAVARPLVAAVSAADQSTWQVRDVAKSAQGWTFTYSCEDSLQAWVRANGKNPAKAVIGEFSTKIEDPINLARPAFDCRGTLSIVFVRSSRAITLKYEHTPFHKTVAQLVNYFKPPPTAAKLGDDTPGKSPKKTSKKEAAQENGEPAIKKSGKKKDASKENGESAAEPTPKKRRATGDIGEAGEGALKKRRKKRGDPATVSSTPIGLLDPLDALSVGETARQSPASPTTNTRGAAVTSTDYPSPPVGQPPSTEANGNGASSHNSIVNVTVTPAEAVRRRDLANKLLKDAGVEPATLSSDQFNIFSNQSPELQKESLAMLVKYGADRLRIVHPTRETTNSPVPPSESEHRPPQVLPPDENITPAAATPSSAQKDETQHSDTMTGNEDLMIVNASPTAGPSSAEGGANDKEKAMKVNRCNNCVKRKKKCGKELPACYNCASSGATCEYPPRKAPSKKDRGNQAQLEIAEETVHYERDNTPNLDSTAIHGSIMVADNSAQPVDNSEPGHRMSQDYFNSEISTSLAHPQGIPSTADHRTISTSRLPDADSHDVDSSINNTPMPYQDAQSAVETYTTWALETSAVLTHTTTVTPQSSAHRNQRSKGSTSEIPPTTAQNKTNQASHINLHQASNWTVASGPQSAPSAPAASSTLTQKQPSRGRSRKAQATRASGAADSSYDSHKGTTTFTELSPPATSSAQIPAAVPAAVRPRGSRYQSPAQTARAKSSQGRRSQMRTPAQDPIPQVGHLAAPQQTQPSQGVSTYNSAAEVGYAPYNTRYSASTNENEPTRIGYEPYAAQNAQARSNPYPTYDGYSSYTPPAATPQAVDTLESLNGRPPAPGARSASNTHNQQRSQTRHQPYNTYSTEGQQQQVLHATAPGQQTSQDWYGFNSANNSFNPTSGTTYHTRGSANDAYGAGAPGTGSYRDIDLGGHGYGQGETENDGLYELLGGSVPNSSR